METTEVEPGPSLGRRRVELVHLAAVMVTAVALVVVIVSSAVLVGCFRPDPGWVTDLSDPLPAPGHAPRGWVRAHSAGLAASLITSVVWAAVVLGREAARWRRTSLLVLAGVVTTVLGCVVAAITWPLVRWDQLALWEVTGIGGRAVRGLWEPATSPEVRFLIVGGAEMGQDAYLRWVIVHLAAPVVALVCLLVVTLVRGGPAGRGVAG